MPQMAEEWCYWSNRAAEELKRASSANDPSAAVIHRQLASLYSARGFLLMHGDEPTAAKVGRSSVADQLN
jgi:hypothetical protein